MSGPEIASIWDRVARVYDWQLPLERRPVEAAVELADPGPEDHVLDVATGTGAVLRALVRRPSRPATVTGLDKSD
ncbi:MAG: hypothetical protein GEU88_08310 [Solirubrobacterales bacterium]|nr:hypothetical protein [Solirubrobacterales bacterium]